VHEELWNQLDVLDRQETSQKALCQYLPDSQCYTINLLNAEFTVDIKNRQIFSAPIDKEPVQANFLQQLCILAYLIGAKDMPLSNKLVKVQSLPGGQFFFRGPHELPTKKIEQAFGDEPQLLYKAAESFNAANKEFGDASVEVIVLPRVPLTFVVWAADEEFDSRATILFDQTASEHLLLDALLAATNLAVDALIKASAQVS